MAAHEDDIIDIPFAGYTSPNYTQVPDELFDQQLPDLSGAELKVLLYIMRRTFGFKKDSDDISLNQICRGITTRDGRVLDRGTGLSKSTAQLAIKGLLTKNIILTTKRVSREKGNEATTYELNVPSRRPYTENRHREAVPISDTALYRKSAQQETVRQQTDRDLSNFEGSHDQVEEPGTKPEPTWPPIGSLVGGLNESPPGPVRLKDVLTTRSQGSGQPQRGRASDDHQDQSEEREQLRAFLADFALELGDEAPLASTITRTLRIFTAAGVPPERWSDFLYQARGLTQEHTAQIRKLATGDSPVRRKNKMPYFLATLEQLVGLRPEPLGQVLRSDNRGADGA
jgi:hypothetical protein